jgi:hypothetical protein
LSVNLPSYACNSGKRLKFAAEGLTAASSRRPHVLPEHNLVGRNPDGDLYLIDRHIRNRVRCRRRASAPDSKVGRGHLEAWPALVAGIDLGQAVERIRSHRLESTRHLGEVGFRAAVDSHSRRWVSYRSPPPVGPNTSHLRVRLE